MSSVLKDIYQQNTATDRRLERRAHERFATQQLAEVQFGNRNSVVQIMNLSKSGANFQIVSGPAPFNNDEVSVKLQDCTYRNGVVRWSSAVAFGIAFDGELGCVREYLDYDTLGHEYFRSLFRLQRSLHGQLGWSE